MKDEPARRSPDPEDCEDLSLEGYSPAAREAIRRRLAEAPEDGPEEPVFDRAVKRTAEPPDAREDD